MIDSKEEYRCRKGNYIHAYNITIPLDINSKQSTEVATRQSELYKVLDSKLKGCFNMDTGNVFFQNLYQFCLPHFAISRWFLLSGIYLCQGQ